jgi:mRNA interferase MazF
MILKHGELYWVNLNPTIGDEIQKRRPVVVLNGGHKKYLRLSIVVPITNWNTSWDDNPFFVTLEPDSENGLTKKSVIDCFQIRAISYKRFLGKIGRISKTELNSIRKAISLILDIDPEHCE